MFELQHPCAAPCAAHPVSSDCCVEAVISHAAASPYQSPEHLATSHQVGTSHGPPLRQHACTACKVLSTTPAAALLGALLEQLCCGRLCC
eukprot:357931-Chlamydomonas_euryale.AAC.5